MFFLVETCPFYTFLRNFLIMYTYVSFKEVGRGVRGLVYFVHQKHFCNHQAVEFTNLNGWRWAGYNAYKMHNVVTTCAGVNFLFSFNAFDFFATTSTNFGSC